MARRIQSQITRQPAVRPVAPVAPNGIADIGQLIAGITQTGTTLARSKGPSILTARPHSPFAMVALSAPLRRGFSLACNKTTRLF